MLIDFCLLRGTRRWSLSCGIAPYSHRRRAARIPSGSSYHGADFGFQAWCEARLHGRPAEQGATKVSLFLTAFLARHGVKASATPDQHFDPRHPRSRGDDRQQEASFWRLLAREGVETTKTPDDRKPV